MQPKLAGRVGTAGPGKSLLQSSGNEVVINSANVSSIVDVFKGLDNGTTVLLDIDVVQMNDIIKVEASDVRISGLSSVSKPQIVCGGKGSGIEVWWVQVSMHTSKRELPGKLTCFISVYSGAFQKPFASITNHEVAVSFLVVNSLLHCVLSNLLWAPVLLGNHGIEIVALEESVSHTCPNLCSRVTSISILLNIQWEVYP